MTGIALASNRRPSGPCIEREKPQKRSRSLEDSHGEAVIANTRRAPTCGSDGPRIIDFLAGQHWQAAATMRYQAHLRD